MISIAGRKIGREFPPFVIAELGINASGDPGKQHRMIDAAAKAGAECVKAQCRIPAEELCDAARTIKPQNAKESAWDLFSRCSFTEDQERDFKAHAESLGMIYLSTPFSIAAVDRLERLGVQAYKTGSGELTNIDFLRYVAARGKPMIVSTGMAIGDEIFRASCSLAGHPFALLHCTSLYPTRYNQVGLDDLAIVHRWSSYGSGVFGLSDHSPGIWTCLGAVALGASILEKHFTCSRDWDGPDISVSIGPEELRDLVTGAWAIWEARGSKHAPGESRTREWYLATRKRT